jgi:Fe-S cluster assembly iron-binding protein IscA
MTVKLEVTSEAQNQVRELIRSQKPGTAVRVFLQMGGGGGGGGCGCGGGGCGGGEVSGPSFGMAFDRPRNGDEVIPVNGFSVVADSLTAAQLDGAKIDFVQELDQSGFQILPKDAPADRPARSGSGCGCGSGGCC